MFIDIINSFKVNENVHSFVESSIKDKRRFSKPPGLMHPYINTLTIMACHTDTTMKLKTIINNIQYFRFIHNDLIIINSIDTKYSKELKMMCNVYNVKYIEIPNTTHLDAGKWMHVLKITSIQPYNFVIFTNDSIFINNPICHFYNKMVVKNVDLFGYNDSTQITYHYQSYLFGIKRNAVHKFITHYESCKKMLTDYISVVYNIELKLIHIFQTKDCFLKIGNISQHIGKNIFFNNDLFYVPLIQCGLLPFIKLKRINADQNTKKKTNKINIILNTT